MMRWKQAPTGAVRAIDLQPIVDFDGEGVETPARLEPGFLRYDSMDLEKGMTRKRLPRAL